jgi:hypothetical protein
MGFGIILSGGKNGTTTSYSYNREIAADFHDYLRTRGFSGIPLEDSPTNTTFISSAHSERAGVLKINGDQFELISRPSHKGSRELTKAVAQYPLLVSRNEERLEEMTEAFRLGMSVAGGWGE